ncbi:MAG: 30S ribosomal protein S18 [bacterium]
MEQQQTNKKRFKQKRPCPLKSKLISYLDYKDVDSYKRYITDRGKIAPRRNTVVSAKFQRYISRAIKRARIMCLIPYEIS